MSQSKSRQIRRAAHQESAVLGREPVNKLSPSALMEELVSDAARFYTTPLERMIPAIDRIASERHKHVDQVLKEIEDAAAERSGGFRWMPGTPAGYRVENP